MGLDAVDMSGLSSERGTPELSVVNSAHEVTVLARGRKPLQDNVKRGVLYKKHRNKTLFMERDVVLDNDDGTLSYYTTSNKEKNSNLFDVLRTAAKKITGSSPNDNSSKLCRKLPLESLECHLVPGEALDLDDIEQVLVMTYREVQGPNEPSITRNMFFCQKKSDGDSGGSLREWYDALLDSKRKHQGRAVARAQSITEKCFSATISCSSIKSAPASTLIRCNTRGSQGRMSESELPDDDIVDDVQLVFQCGWVHKNGHGVPSKWHRRFLIVDNFRLRYFKRPLDALPLYELPLDGGGWSMRNGMPDLFPETNHPFCFTVKSTTREYYFRTQSGDDTADWVEILQKLEATYCSEKTANVQVQSRHVSPRQSVDSDAGSAGKMPLRIVRSLPADSAVGEKDTGSGQDAAEQSSSDTQLRRVSDQ